MEIENAGSQVAAIHELVSQYAKPQLVEIAGRDAMEKAAVLLAPSHLHLIDLQPQLEALRENPRRRRGTVTAHDLPSLVLVCNRYKDDQSAVYASLVDGQPAMTAIFDYHETGAPGVGKPRFGDHRAHYKFPLSVEWRAWIGQDGKRMAQTDFAAYIEDHISEITPAPAADQMAPETLALQQMLGGDFAAPNRMMELARGLAIREGVQVKGFTNLATGEATMEMATEHTDEKGKPLKIPGLFLITIPVFEGGQLYRIAVRLRYRVTNQGVMWFFQMFRADKALKLAFEEACAIVAAETNLPVYRGTPESIGGPQSPQRV